MDKTEAAQALGVSVRTVERLASNGRLKKGRGLRDGRPVVAFDSQEVSRLRAELEQGAPPPKSKAGSEASSHRNDYVGFRLDRVYLRQLEERGSRAGMSRGEYARHLIVQSLEDDREQKFIGEVRRLREGVADVFFTFLTRHSGVDSEDAKAFIAETILKEEPS